MKLSAYMEARSLKDADIARLVGRERSVVTRWRRGDTRPDWDAMRKIVEVTGGDVTPNDFMEPSPAPQPEAAE